MIAYFNKRPVGMIAAIALILIVLWSQTWVRGRQWILSDLNTPSYDQPSSVSLLFHSPQLDSGLAVMESLKTDTPISKSMGGYMESRAYTIPVIGLRYVKISAPSEKIQQIASIARDHLAARYPDLNPGFSFSIATH
ncbi:MAG: hypothetical protein EAZ42_02025 [Verrucomicrobia bacterium]|nr:MAG: hypothetical protein EAZ42_02025 [Verrucomicrobiota bacterium]